MPYLNLVQLIGHATREPEVSYTPRGVAVAELGLALNRRYHTEAGEPREETTFVDITFFGRPAETLRDHVRKGRLLHVAGRLKLDTWTDKTTGKPQSRLRVSGENWQFLGAKPTDRPRETQDAAQARDAPPPAQDFSEEDIPF
jgi:single-strand DNA-binding protein